MKTEGYRDARVDFDRVQGETDVVITFTIDRGPRYEIAAVRVVGNTSVPTAEIRGLVRVSDGDAFSEETLGVGVANVRGTYRLRGFASVGVVARQNVIVPERATDNERRIELALEIVEGPRTVVRAVAFEGHTVMTAERAAGSGRAAGRPPLLRGGHHRGARPDRAGVPQPRLRPDPRAVQRRPGRERYGGRHPIHRRGRTAGDRGPRADRRRGAHQPRDHPA